MTYRIQAGKEVAHDVEAACRAYDELRAGLGDELFVEIYEAMRSLEDNPFLFQKRYGE